jgi:molybdopterin-guanine dinucleotide biosynthesis protein A
MAGIVLCGGASRRMGRDKATLEVTSPEHGVETLLERAARHLREAGADPVLVATGTAGRLGSTPWREVDDLAHRGDGPLAGILAGLRHAPHPVVAVLAVDLPDARPAILRWLRAAWTETDAALVPLDPEGRPQPLHALYATATADAIEAALARGERRVLRVVEAAGARYLAPPPDLATGSWARHLNTPDPAGSPGADGGRQEP